MRHPVGGIELRDTPKDVTRRFHNKLVECQDLGRDSLCPITSYKKFIEAK
ncbi:MAG: hypothetical protein QXS68_08600 [Candidatus Methanomethylicaceae archaeon]